MLHIAPVKIRKLIILLISDSSWTRGNSSVCCLNCQACKVKTSILPGRTNSFATYPTRQRSIQIKITSSQTQTLLAEHLVAEDYMWMSDVLLDIAVIGIFPHYKESFLTCIWQAGKVSQKVLLTKYHLQMLTGKFSNVWKNHLYKTI